MENYEKLIAEKEDIKKKKKLKEIEEDKILFEQINAEIDNEKKEIIAKKAKAIEESKKLKEINEKLIQEKKSMKKQNQDDFIEQNIFQPNSV